jgi:hypothetical protein
MPTLGPKAIGASPVWLTCTFTNISRSKTSARIACLIDSAEVILTAIALND